MENEDIVLNEMQTKENKMLRDLNDIFVRNDIQYFLACGTALGCVRHSGFIPWDDDVDIYVWGKDYEKIRNVFATQDTGCLRLHDHTTVKDYPYSFPKIIANDTVLVEKSMEHLDYSCGVYIDLFPLIVTNDNVVFRWVDEFFRYIDYSFVRTYYYQYNDRIKSVINKIIRKCIKPVKFQDRLYKIYQKDQSKSKYIIDAGVFGRHALLYRADFNGVEYLPFNNQQFPVPIGYDNYLKMYYGDYMMLPNFEDRVSNHHIAKLEIEGRKLI